MFRLFRNKRTVTRYARGARRTTRASRHMSVVLCPCSPSCQSGGLQTGGERGWRPPAFDRAGSKPKSADAAQEYDAETVRERLAPAAARGSERPMKIGAPKETFDGEKRVAMTPQSAAALKKLGYDCLIEAGAGVAARFSDAAYAEAGVEVVPSGRRALGRGRHRRQGAGPHAGGDRADAVRADRGELRLSGAEPRASGEPEGQGRHGARHGHGAAHQPGAEDGRALVDGQHRRLPRGDRGGARISGGSSPGR